MKKNTVIAIANQKGGAGKTTTAINIGVILRQKGYKVLLVDLDPQNSLSTTYLKHEYDPEQPTVYELMDAIIKRYPISIDAFVCHNEVNDIDYIPSDIRLSNMERQLVVTRCSETVLQRAFKKAQPDYDYIIIDCPPSLSTLLYNALCAAKYVLVPVMAQILALDGVPMLLDTVIEVQENVNPDLEILGYIATVFEKQTKMSNDVEDTLKENFGSKYWGYISKSTGASLSSEEGRALSLYKDTRDNRKYTKLAKEYEVIAERMIASIN